MKKIFFTLAGFYGVLSASLFGNFLSAQQGVVGLEWARHYNVSDSLYSSGFDVDAHGCVYVCGVTQNTNTGNGEITVVKYSQDGELKWSSAFPNPGADLDNARPKLKIGSGCSVFVGFNYVPFTGATNTDIYVVKLDSAGSWQWTAAYNGPGNDKDSFTSLALDNLGNTYVSGSSYVNGTNGEDFLVVKFNSAGVQQWEALHNGLGNGNDAANSVAVDNSGNVYATGFTYNASSNTDYTTIRYNSNGTEAWAVNFDGQDNLNDYAAALKVDINGNIAITGSTQTNADAYDFATIKYNSSGVQQWANYFSYSQGKDEIAVAIAIDNTGNIFVTGNSGDATQQTTNPALSFADTIITIKYSSAGTQQWAAPEYFINTNPNTIVIATASTVTGLVLDALGNAYIAGYRLDNTFNFQNNQQSAGYSFITVKYNQQGMAEWKRGFTGTLFNNPQQNFHVGVSFGLSVPKEDTVYVAGGSINSGVFAITTVKFSPCAITADAGQNATISTGQNAQIGNTSLPNLIYSWSPVDGLDDPNIANPLASPTATTSYILTVRRQFNTQCLVRDTVNVNVVSLACGFASCSLNTPVLSYVCNSFFDPCGNIIANPGFEIGSLPNNRGGICDNYADCWRPECCGPCGGRPDNSPDLFDANVASVACAINCQPLNCIGIPFNFTSNTIGINTNNPVPGVRHAGMHGNEKMSAALSGPITNSVYYFEFYAAASDICGAQSIFCSELIQGGNPPLCPGGNVLPLISLAPPGSNLLNGSSSWQRYGFCFDISDPIMYPPAFLQTLDRITISQYNPAVQGDHYYFFDDFALYNLTNLADLVQDFSICIPQCSTLTNCSNPIPGFNYSWFPSAGLSCTNCPNPIACPVTTTTYFLTVTDPTGACVFTDQVTVTVNPATVANAGPDQSICLGSCANLNATGGVTYSWFPATGLSNVNIANPVACNLPVGTYIYNVTVTDANGCTATDQVTVTVSNPSVVASATQQNICTGGCTNLSAAPSGGATPYTFTWTDPSVVICGPSVACSTVTNVCPAVTTTYNVLVTDAAGCTATDQVTVTVNSIPPPAPVISGNPNDCTNPTTYSVQNPDPNFIYGWTITNGSPATSSGPNVTVTWSINSSSPVGTIVLTATDPLTGCSLSATMYVYKCCEAFVGIPPLPPPAFNNTDLASEYSANPGLFTTIPGGYQMTNQIIVINGVFIVNQDLVLENCEWLMGAEARIKVMSGKTLTLQTVTSSPQIKTLLRAGCDIMWDGIYLEDNLASLISTTAAGISSTINYTTIQNARNAIVSDQGGDYRISKTVLQFNNIDVMVNQFTGNHTGFIRQSILQTGVLNTVFDKMFPYFTGNVLNPALPRTNIGVKINSVANITIGDAGAASFQNTFDNMDFGIHSILSKITVYNNTFQNLNTNNVFLPNGIGVYAVGGKKLSLGVTVGGPGLQANTFTNTTAGAFTGFGVFVKNFIPDIDVINNTFTRNYYSAVLVTNCPNGTIDISNNTIKENPQAPFSTFFGIACIDITGSTTNITFNTIDDLNASTSAKKSTTGITVQNVNASNMNLLIQNNAIKFHRTGIHLVGVTGPAANNPAVDNNAISFPPMLSSFTANSKHYGIRLQNCSNVHVKQNTISRNGANPNFAMVLTLQGINVENSTSCIIGRNNTMTRMGSGIYCDMSDNNSTLACNDFVRCWNGIFFNNAIVGDQLPLGVAQQNEWIAHVGNFTMSGSMAIPIPATNFYYFTSPSSQDPTLAPGVDPALSPAGGLNVTTATSTFDVCPSLQAPPPPDPTVAERNQLVGSIVKNQRQFAQNNNEFRVYDRKFAHKFLKDNPALLQLNAPDDTTYINFFNTENTGNIGKFSAVQDLIQQGDTLNALSSNGNIIASSVMESNRQTVNDVYIRSWMKGILPFSSSDSSVLLNIALQNPLLGGDGVYSARVMLGIDPGNSSNRIMFDENNNEFIPAESMAGKIYPNPARNEAILNYKIEEDQRGTVELISIMGEKISSYDLLPDEILKFDLTSIPVGMYFYRIQVNEETVVTDKLIIIK